MVVISLAVGAVPSVHNACFPSLQAGFAPSGHVGGFPSTFVGLDPSEQTGANLLSAHFGGKLSAHFYISPS